MVAETEIAWLAGIFDGEGSARIYRKKGGNFWSQVSAVSNTDALIIEKVCRILDALGISYSLRRDNGNKTKSMGYSLCSDVRITKIESVKLYLETIAPHSTGGKKFQAELVLSFLRLPRLQNGKRGNQPRSLEACESLWKSQKFRARSANGQSAEWRM